MDGRILEAFIELERVFFSALIQKLWQRRNRLAKKTSRKAVYMGGFTLRFSNNLKSSYRSTKRFCIDTREWPGNSSEIILCATKCTRKSCNIVSDVNKYLFTRTQLSSGEERIRTKWTHPCPVRKVVTRWYHQSTAAAAKSRLHLNHSQFLVSRVPRSLLFCTKDSMRLPQTAFRYFVFCG